MTMDGVMSIIISAAGFISSMVLPLNAEKKAFTRLPRRLKNVSGPHGGDEAQEKGCQGQGLRSSLKFWDPAQKEGYKRIGAADDEQIFHQHSRPGRVKKPGKPAENAGLLAFYPRFSQAEQQGPAYWYAIRAAAESPSMVNVIK